MSERLAENLRVVVGQAASLDVVTGVRVTLHVGVTNAEPPQLVEFVVLADPRERDAVVDLADLAQRVGRVLGYQQNAVEVLNRHESATARDALARVVGPILHHLLGGDVERHVHDAEPRAR